MTIFDLPKEMPSWLLLYPSFNICRIFYYLTMKCGYSSCIASLSDLDPELIRCIIWLYITPVIYIVLGIYLYEVLPQQFGVRKHPLFFLHCKKPRRKSSIMKHIEEDKEMKNSDEEINEEIRKIRELEDEEKSNYPLVVDNLTKIYDSNRSKGRKALNGLNLLLNNNEIFGLLG